VVKIADFSDFSGSFGQEASDILAIYDMAAEDLSVSPPDRRMWR
jgi:hypothetical protein